MVKPLQFSAVPTTTAATFRFSHRHAYDTSELFYIFLPPLSQVVEGTKAPDEGSPTPI